jgi:hypothetical protein
LRFPAFEAFRIYQETAASAFRKRQLSTFHFCFMERTILFAHFKTHFAGLPIKLGCIFIWPLCRACDERSKNIIQAHTPMRA